MIKVKKEGILLNKTKYGFENNSVCNPAAIRDGEFVHLYYRAVRDGNYSSIGYCTLKGPIKVLERDKKPILFPEKISEKQGVEDPRITKINETYYLTYSAYDNINVLGTYATSTDLKKFKKQKIISPKFTFREYKHFIECCIGLNSKYLFHYKVFKEHGLGDELSKKLYVWDKNLVLFPKKKNGKYMMLHRIYPGIQIIYFNDFNELTKEFWKNYMINLEKYIVMDPKFPHESSHIGAGCPPIETKDGWLLIYHSAEATPTGFVYHASAALLDLNNPIKVVGRLNYPLISPTLNYEKEGVVNNIIFPSGSVVFDETLYIYYGAADTSVAVASLNLNELLKELKNSKP
jgi:predicted GH43/DUF377 family glycosyl hydrolase